MFKSLSSRLLASYVLIILVCLTFAGAVTFLLLQGFRINSLKASLTERSTLLAVQARRLVLDDAPLEEIESLLNEQAEALNTRILLVNQQGRILVDSQGELVGSSVQLKIPPLARQTETALPKLTGQFRTPSGENLVYGGAPAVPASRPNASKLWVVLASPLRGGAYLMGDLLRRLLLAGGIACLLSIVAALLITRSVGRPIQQVIGATEQVAAGDYDLKLDVQSPDEVRRLAESFNVMAGKVAASHQTQRDFLANVSHELRTPLTSIRGFAQAILDGAAEDPESQRRAAEVIHQESERMIRMVEELLDLAKIEAGQIQMDLHPLDMRALMENTARQLQPQAASHEIQLLLDLEPTPAIAGDGDRLVQVLTNLVDNALRYTPAGGQVTLALHPLAGPAPAEKTVGARISVTDTGPGIPSEERSRLFERFYQVDKSRARKKGGTGLGLAIAKEIVEAHDGSIRVESIEGLGTRFVVDLPAAPAT